MSKRLRPELMNLLQEVVSKYQPDLLPAFERLAKGLATSRDERHDLIFLAMEELARTGFLETEESVKRGLMLEEIADFLGDMQENERADE